MDFKFNKDNVDSEVSAEQPREEKGRQTGMLVLLLVLLGGFGYLYFFTGLIRPQEPPPAPPQPPQVVKQPLPARDAAPASAVKPADQKAGVAAVAAVPSTPSAKPPQKPAEVKTAAVPVVKPEDRKPEPKPAAKESVKPVAAPVAKQPAAPAVAKAEQKKPSPAKAEEKKPATVAAPADKQAEPVKPAKKQPVAPKTVGPWVVVVGLYVVEETLAEDMAKVKKVGLTPVMTAGPKRPVTMHRLFYGDYTSKQEAQQAVDTLRRTAGSGFSVQRGDKYEVFAGSYAVLSGAQSEQQRLSAAGVKVAVRKTQVALASRKLTAGTFTDRKAAADVLKKLKAAGIGAPEIE